MHVYAVDGVRDYPEISFDQLFRSPMPNTGPLEREEVRLTTPLEPVGDNRGATRPVRTALNDCGGQDNTDDARGLNLNDGLLQSLSPWRTNRPMTWHPGDQEGISVGPRTVIDRQRGETTQP